VCVLAMFNVYIFKMVRSTNLVGPFSTIQYSCYIMMYESIESSQNVTEYSSKDSTIKMLIDLHLF
jgi:hypothetical protein